MAEAQTVVPRETISFEGFFSVKEVHDLIMDWIFTKGYVPVESKAQQVVKKDAKFFEYTFIPFKKLSDYAKSCAKIVVSASDCKDIIAEIAGKKKKMQDGKVLITVEGILETDYESKWEKTGWLYAFRVIFEKYVISPFISDFEKTVSGDVGHLIAQLRGYFNLQKKLGKG
jgi:hypothetical protein